MSLIRSTPSTFDAHRSPASPSKAGQQPASDIWGVGKKTVERLREKLALDPAAKLTVADFAYVDLDKFEMGDKQRSLLQQQQAALVNVLHVAPEGANPAVAGELVAKMNAAISAALDGIKAEVRSGGFVQDEITSFAAAIGMSYGIHGAVRMASPDQVAKANELGMKAGDGQVPLAVHRPDDSGVVVVLVRPRELLEPVVVQIAEGQVEHSFTASHSNRQPVPGYVIEEPADPFARLKSLETQARDAAAAVWVDDDPAGRRRRFEVFDAAIDKLATAIGATTVGANHASQLHGALQALRSIRDITSQHLES